MIAPLGWALLLCVSCALLLAIPLLPAYLEWRHPRDNQPLRVIRNHDGHVEHFATSFRQFVGERLGAELASAGAANPLVRGSLPDGVQYMILGARMEPPFDANDLDRRESAQLIVSREDLQLPAGWILATEIYALASARVGRATALRAILADRDLVLEEDCQVLRWAHARGSIEAGAGCQLAGRASAGQSITLGRGSRFNRLSAPRLYFGATATHPVLAPSAVGPSPVVVAGARRPRTVHSAAYQSKSGEAHPGDLIARGAIHLASGNRVDGAVKAHGNLLLDADCEVGGALIAIGAVRVGARCRIAGPVVSEFEIHIGADAILGSLERPVTLTAPRITLESGAIVYGSVWAREAGRVAS